MKPWRVPRELEGRTVAVLASGPAMSAEVVEQLRAAGVPTIAVNTTFRLAPDAWALYAADASWWMSTPGALQFAGHRISCSPVEGVRRVLNVGSEGWTDDPACLHTYGNSGAQAIQIAVKAGAARVLLCGFGFAGGHWHGEHPAPLRRTPMETYARWASQMERLCEHIKRSTKCEVLNCTPKSAIQAFPKCSLADALKAP